MPRAATPAAPPCQRRCCDGREADATREGPRSRPTNLLKVHASGERACQRAAVAWCPVARITWAGGESALRTRVGTPRMRRGWRHRCASSESCSSSSYRRSSRDVVSPGERSPLRNAPTASRHSGTWPCRRIRRRDPNRETRIDVVAAAVRRADRHLQIYLESELAQTQVADAFEHGVDARIGQLENSARSTHASLAT